jgi:hypothetical protein
MSASLPQDGIQALPREGEMDPARELPWSVPEEAVLRRLTRERLLARERLAVPTRPMPPWSVGKLPAAE